MSHIEKIVLSAFPDELELPSPSKDHVGHVVYLTLKGHTKLAADHLLHPEMRGHLEETVGNVTRQLNLAFNKALLERTDERNIILCARVYDALINMALNLYGLERRIVGFSESEVDEAVTRITRCLMDIETLERKGVFGDESGKALIAKAVVTDLLSEMKKVMEGFYRPPGSMVAHVAKEIEKGIDEENIVESFLNSARQQIQGNIYYRIGEAGMCKFGNDYALGLRWLRHLGFVQVSTNPSLAAIAYDDDPSQWEGYRGENLCPDFKTIAKEHPELLDAPEAHADEITAYATEVSIWRNLTVFRPIAIASNMFHGMISLQLNPNIADSLKDSIRYALKFYSDAEEFLKKYDAYLLWGYPENIERGRPNIVFKVAGSSPASIDITRKLESLGIGTNNTVTFTVSQETELILAKLEGRADAVKKGIPVTTVYETNMGGRLDDHIREIQAEKLIKKALAKVNDKEKALRKLAESLQAWDAVKDKASLEEKIVVISSRRFLNPLNKEPLIDFLAERHKYKYKIEKLPTPVKGVHPSYFDTAAQLLKARNRPEVRELQPKMFLRDPEGKFSIQLTVARVEELAKAEEGVLSRSRRKVKEYLDTLENDIQYCGILVTMRVYEIFFSPQNRTKWISYLQSKYGLTPGQAEEVMRGIDVLPASKRKPKETLMTLAGANMTHTEFPNHQMNVLIATQDPIFKVENCKESVLKGIDPEILRRLTGQWTDIKDLLSESYELTPNQRQALKEAKITHLQKYGSGGIVPSKWRAFGSTAKTMEEFSASYEAFRKKCVEFVRRISKG